MADLLLACEALLEAVDACVDHIQGKRFEETRWKAIHEARDRAARLISETRKIRAQKRGK